MSTQVISGFFRRFGAGAALCKMHLFYNLSRVFNVLETMEGAGGIVIDKPAYTRGYGWRIRFVGAWDLQPQLWDGMIDKATQAVKVYCGDGSQPWFISADGETGYAGALTGWQTVTAGEYYITMDSGLAPAFDTTAPNYSAGTYGVKVGTATAGTWVKKFSGPFQISVPPGDSTNTALSWDNANGKWVKATPSAGGTLTEVTYITAMQFDASSKELQIKTRTGKVVDAGTESGWTEAHQAASFAD